MKRRTVITAAVALPCIGVVGSAPAATANATDAAWSAYETGRARYDADKAARDAAEAATGVYAGISDEDLDALCNPIRDAESAILAAPATTLTDVERKLTVISNWGGDHLIEADRVDGILADVRLLNGARMMGDAS